MWALQRGVCVCVCVCVCQVDAGEKTDQESTAGTGGAHCDDPGSRPLLRGAWWVEQGHQLDSAHLFWLPQ